VLCHTDIGGGKLLVDDDGWLILLDWDDATVAPPEHDLHCALDTDFARLLAAYRDEPLPSSRPNWRDSIRDGSQQR